MVKKNKNKIIIKIIIAILLWSIFWFSGQALFFINLDLPFLNFVQNFDKNIIMLVYTLWVLFVSLIALIIYRWKINDFSFLKIKNKKILWLYIIPLVFAIIIIINGSPFGYNRYLNVFAMTTTTFLAQDVLTFGFLQTYLEKLINPIYAFFVTSTVFFSAHLAYDLSYYTLILVFGALLFGFLRYKTKNIDLLNIIHTSFLLIPI